MGALMRDYDWASHPLGNPELWQESLKTNIRLMLNSGFPMFIWWSNELYAFHNDPYLPALGDKHPQALGAPARLLWKEIWSDLEGMVNRIFQDGIPSFMESLLLYLERKGFAEETYWTFSYSPIYNDVGEVYGVFCACYETTKSVLDQRRLKSLKDISEAMSKVQHVDEACRVACDILVENKMDIPFNLIYLNNEEGTQARLVGQAGNFRKGFISEVLDLKGQTDKPCPMRQAFISKQSVIFDYPEDVSLSGASGKQAVVLPIFRSGQDKIIGFQISGINPHLEYDAEYKGFHSLMTGQISTAIDVVQAREEVARQREYLIQLFQQAPVGICIARGPEYVLDLVNPFVCEIWGKTEAEVLGKPVLEALPEIKDQGIMELLDQVRTTGIPYINNELPVEFIRNGKLETVYCNFIYHPMYNSAGEITGIIAVAINVNEQVQARHEMEALNKELLTTNADLDNFVYSASHDLKAPISNIEGLMQALIRNLPPQVHNEEKTQKLIGLIQGSIERFKKAVADLTQVSKVQREETKDVAVINLAEVLAEILPDFESLITDSNATIETSFAEDVSIRFSAKNMRSILYNLISNSLKYRSPERKPMITIATSSESEYYILSVEDNGLGMNMEDKGKIFSMFKRLHDHVEGSGVGLYIVKKIVENAGGRIEVESQVNQGSKFIVYFKKN